MIPHVLLNLENMLGKSDQMRGLPSISLPFRKEFNKINNTKARIFDAIHHILWNRVFDVKNVILPYISNVFMAVFTLFTKLRCKMLMHAVISLPDATSYDKNMYSYLNGLEAFYCQGTCIYQHAYVHCVCADEQDDLRIGCSHMR